MSGRRTGAWPCAAMAAFGWLGLALATTSLGCSPRPRRPAPSAAQDEPVPPEAALTPEEAAKALKAQPRIKQKP